MVKRKVKQRAAKKLETERKENNMLLKIVQSKIGHFFKWLCLVAAHLLVYFILFLKCFSFATVPKKHRHFLLNVSQFPIEKCRLPIIRVGICGSHAIQMKASFHTAELQQKNEAKHQHTLRQSKHPSLSLDVYICVHFFMQRTKKATHNFSTIFALAII